MTSDQFLFHTLNPRTLLKRFEFGSFVIAPYLVAIVWEYFWTFEHTPIAWILTVVISAGVWVAYLTLADDPPPPLSWQFWLVVALPLLLFYLIRLPFPDISFDVLNYHIFHSERALRGPLLISGDFFPTPAPFNPAPDIVAGLYRHVLGYRLGTVVNLLALIWTATIIDRVLRDWIKSAWLRSLATVGALATEQMLFQINNYMIDLLALPILFEATRLAIKTTGGERIVREVTRLSFLLGIAAAFKLANLMYAAPIVLIYGWNVFVGRGPNGIASVSRLAKAALSGALVFVLPLLPFTFLIYRLTGNPVFPFYNGLFKSPYWPQGAPFDPRWGPHGFAETLSWPVVMFFRPDRLSEYPFYSGRLSIGILAAVAVIFFGRKHRMIWQLALITLFGGVAWSASSGYIRYALFLELTCGVLIIWLVAQSWQMFCESKTWRPALILAPFAALLALQILFGLAHGYRWEWAARETIVGRPARDNITEIGNLFRDRSLSTYLTADDLNSFADVDGWVETSYKTSAFMGLLKPEAPAMGVRVGEYFLTPVARRKFNDVWSLHRGQRMFTLTDRENYDNARDRLAQRGLMFGEARPISIYYFSPTLKFDVLLIQVVPKDNVVAKGAPLPDSAFNAKLSVTGLPETLRAGQKYQLRVMLKNESDVKWPGTQPTWQFQLTVGNRWLKENGQKVTDIDARAALSDDLLPGATVEVPLMVTAPSQPGIYILQLDAIQEGVAWFGERGSEVLSLKIRVE